MQNLEVLRAIKACLKIELLSAFKASESFKESEKGFDDTKKFSKGRIEKIRKEFNESRHKFFKSKIKKIR